MIWCLLAAVQKKAVCGIQMLFFWLSTNNVNINIFTCKDRRLEKLGYACVCATEVGCLSKSKIMIYLTGPLVHPDSEAPLIQI